MKHFMQKVTNSLKIYMYINYILTILKKFDNPQKLAFMNSDLDD